MSHYYLSDHRLYKDKNYFYCGKNPSLAVESSLKGCYIFDLLSAKDYININETAFQTSRNWHIDNSIDWTQHDCLKISESIENLLFTSLLRGTVEKYLSIIKFITQFKPEHLILDIKDLVFSNLVAMILDRQNISYHKVTYRKSKLSTFVNNRLTYLKNFFGFFATPFLLNKASSSHTDFRKKQKLLFYFSPTHLRALEPIMASPDKNNILVRSITSPRLRQFFAKSSSNNILIDEFVDYKVWKLYKSFRKRILLSKKDSSVLNFLASRFEINGHSYFPAIQDIFFDFILKYVPNSACYFELCCKLYKKLLPSIAIFGDDASHRARAAITAARKHNIPTLLVQHGIIASKELYYPYSDFMAIWGEHSKKIMINNGIIASRLFIVGCPSFDLMAQPQKLPSRTNSLLIITNPPPTGFNKLQTNCIYNFLSELYKHNIDIDVTIKIHPHEQVKDYTNALSNFKICILKAANLTECIANSFAVVTFYSTVAIQSILMNKPVVCLPTTFPEDTSLKQSGFVHNPFSIKDATNDIVKIYKTKDNFNSLASSEIAEFCTNYCAYSQEDSISKYQETIDFIIKEHNNYE
jgi:hypothetical protein